MDNRIPTDYTITREQKRYIAKKNMKKANIKNFCKHSYTTIKRGSFVMSTREPSYFAEHWREYVKEAI